MSRPTEAVAYTVVEGDDIQTVAGRYDVTVEDIQISNGLETEEIAVGSVIYIPPKHARGYYDPENGTYLVAPGDDLLEIARRFGTTVEALEQANGLDSAAFRASVGSLYSPAMDNTDRRVAGDKRNPRSSSVPQTGSKRSSKPFLFALRSTPKVPV